METPQVLEISGKQPQRQARGSITATASMDFAGLNTSSPSMQAAHACASALVLGKIRSGVAAAGEVLDMASVGSSRSSGGRSSHRSGRASSSSQNRRFGRGMRSLGAVRAELAFAQDLSPMPVSPAAAVAAASTPPSSAGETLSLLALAPAQEGAAPVPQQEPESGASPAEVDGSEEDSVALARRLMQEESMLVYRQLQQATVQMALASMQGAGTQDMDEDTRLSLRLMQAEVQQMHGSNEEDLAAIAEASAVAESAEEEEGGGGAEMDYEALLQLGEELGDVRTERWQARASGVISKLPVGPWSGRGESMCAICRCDFDDAASGSATDEEETEEVMKLPCGHEFHSDCATQWLKDHPVCPYCKAGIEPGSPAKPAKPETTLAAAASSSASSSPEPATGSTSSSDDEAAAAPTPAENGSGRKRPALSPLSE